MIRKYNKSNGDLGGIGVGIVGVGGVIAIVIWVISIVMGTTAQQEAKPVVDREFTGTITSASITGSEYLTNSFLGYNLFSDEWETMWSYYEKQTWTFTLELENGTVITCTKVFLADTVNISLFYSDVDGTIPTGINAKVTGSYADDKTTFKVNTITNTATNTNIELYSPALPPGTTSAPAPAAA